ncbi:MAG: amidohydrolase family protein [bacterium]|nr:amidohydrolase family protein [bacterium]
MPLRLDRRRFLRTTGGALGAATLGLAGCTERRPYTDVDKASLVRQREEEARRTGQGPFGVQRFQGYRGLSELPWYELDDAGVLRLADDSVPWAIDFHTHLGMSLFLAPTLDLSRPSDRVRHLLDCDATDPGCPLDLDIYINGNFTPEQVDALPTMTIAQGFTGSDIVDTHTIPNLLREMDAVHVSNAVLLPIVFDLPFGDDVEALWRDGLAQTGAADRLWLGTSVHPGDADAPAQLERAAAAGARVVKLHPTMQAFHPDEDSAMAVYEAADRLGLVIFFHGGRAGVEPESRQGFAMPRHYEGAVSAFPNLPFVMGHGGARDAAGMLDLATRFENVWLGIHGQGVTWLDEMIRRTGGERLLFGTDWPWYHLAATQAKVLIVTRDPGRAEIRHAILRGNAERLLRR